MYGVASSASGLPPRCPSKTAAPWWQKISYSRRVSVSVNISSGLNFAALIALLAALAVSGAIIDASTILSRSCVVMFFSSFIFRPFVFLVCCPVGTRRRKSSEKFKFSPRKVGIKIQQGLPLALVGAVCPGEARVYGWVHGRRKVYPLRRVVA